MPEQNVETSSIESVERPPPATGPYRATIEPPTPAELERHAQEFNAEIAFTLTFLWATAVLRFVIACRRHEDFMGTDPFYAALLTFGIAGVVLGYLVIRAWRRVVKVLAALRAILAT